MWLRCGMQRSRLTVDLDKDGPGPERPELGHHCEVEDRDAEAGQMMDEDLKRAANSNG